MSKTMMQLVVYYQTQDGGDGGGDGIDDDDNEASIPLATKHFKTWKLARPLYSTLSTLHHKSSLTLAMKVN